MVFLKMPELEIEEKLEVGIGEGGFLYLANPAEILVLNEMQAMLWRRPGDDEGDRKM